MDEKEGHQILASLCANDLDELKQKGVYDATYSSTENYALHHGVQHMLQLDKTMLACSLEECVQTYVIDLELLYAKLCVNNSIAAEDILWLQSQELSQALSEDSKVLLNTLMILLRKYFNVFTNRPWLFFQTVLNEGEIVLSRVASNLLQNKYPEIPYMELVHKQMQRTVLARFQCSSPVACFDVSPQLDYMVCECDDGMIQLWSLHTGKPVWERPVVLKKLHFGNGAYRISPSSSGAWSFYRSVVFHPTEDVILPGVLSHAYNFDGDLKPLFPESNCSFTVCSISEDKSMILTDCYDNAKCIIMWSLKNGSEITRTTRNDDVLSFAWSRDGKIVAISHSTGSICLVDAVDGFRTLAETALPESCGMIKFSPECRSLLCFGGAHLLNHLFRLNINMAEHPSCTLDVCINSYVPWKFESRSEAGFLLGDPLSSVNVDFDFVLNKKIVLRGSPGDIFVDMLNINELQKTDNLEAKAIKIKEIAFSLSGQTVYAVVRDVDETTVRAWDVPSGELVGQVTANVDYLVAVKEGVLLTTITRDTLELWNFELSECIRNWINLKRIRRVIPISEERVACKVENQVILLDTISGEIVSTIPVGCMGFFVARNSKCQLLTCSRFSLELSDGKTTLWKNNLRFTIALQGIFSPSERFVVICTDQKTHQEMYVLDAVSGKALHSLSRGGWPHVCKFVSDEECVVYSKGHLFRMKSDSSLDKVLLFNVKSGHLLSEIELERQVCCLAACPRMRLLAIDQSDSKHGFKLIQVRMPQDNDSRKDIRVANTRGSMTAETTRGLHKQKRLK